MTKSKFKKFDETMDRLMKVSHAQIKAKIDAGRASKSQKPKRKKGK